jgi:hypothetical protein
MITRKEVIKRLQDQLQWRSHTGRLMGQVMVPREHAEFIIENLIHLTELHPNEKTF